MHSTPARDAHSSKHAIKLSYRIDILGGMPAVTAKEVKTMTRPKTCCAWISRSGETPAFRGCCTILTRTVAAATCNDLSTHEELQLN